MVQSTLENFLLYLKTTTETFGNVSQVIFVSNNLLKCNKFNIILFILIKKKKIHSNSWRVGY